MSKYIIAAIIMVAMIVPTTAAADPPTNPWSTAAIPWGTDCDNWVGYWNSVTTNHLIYDPVNNWYYDCVTGAQVVWPEFQIDLFFELEIQVYFDWTLAQIHRVSVYDPIVLTMYGWIEQNGGNYIVIIPGALDPAGNAYDLDQLNFIEDVLGRQGALFGSPIPVTWEYSLDNVTYLPMIPDGNNYIFLIEEPCTHDFWMRITINPDWHEDDGWYKLHGELCPLANL